MATILSEDSWTRVGQTIRTMREMRGMTADQLATAVGKSRPYIANIEAGRKPLPPKLLPRVADALHVPQIAILNATSDVEVGAA
jgi:transcriptional regulator with XRE-family HTH domain